MMLAVANTIIAQNSLHYNARLPRSRVRRRRWDSM